jgi:hypothetical protein
MSEFGTNRTPGDVRNSVANGGKANMPGKAHFGSDCPEFREKVMRVYTVGFPIARMLTDRDRSVSTTHLIRE